MNTLYSDDELRKALDAARRSWEEAQGARSQQGGQSQQSSQMQQGDVDMNFAQVKAVYHRLGCAAAKRWGLLR